jgi:hypothetical protein
MPLVFKPFCSVVALLFLIPTSIYPGQKPKKGALPWQEARRPDAMGTRIPVAEEVKKLLAAAPRDCANSEPGERTNFDAFRIQVGVNGKNVIAIGGRGACFCSPTGNCDFWVLHGGERAYEVVLKIKMVQRFGFLKSDTTGPNDLVVWSHDSATRSQARLYRFDGKKYRKSCGWEEEYTYTERPDGSWVSTGEPKITGNTCSVRSQKQ